MTRNRLRRSAPKTYGPATKAISVFFILAFMLSYCGIVRRDRPVTAPPTPVQNYGPAPEIRVAQRKAQNEALQRRAKEQATRQAEAVRRSNTTPQPASASCPCSGSANCYGPRGGRFCITSGGSKRYR